MSVSGQLDLKNIVCRTVFPHMYPQELAFGGGFKLKFEGTTFGSQ